MAIGNKTLLALFLALVPQHFVVAAQTVQDALEVLKKQDYQPALRILRPLAEQGDVQAQYNLAKIYDEGLGVPKDDVEAVNWYRKAADQGFAQAQTKLVALYRKGPALPKHDAQPAHGF